MTHRRRRGFTLLEVMLAIALALAVSGGIGFFLSDLFQRRAMLREMIENDLASSSAIDRLEADLLACIVGTASHGSGVVGDAHGIRLLTRAVTPPLQGGAVGVALGDLQGSEIRFDPEGSRLLVRRWDALSDVGPGEWEVLSDRVDRLRLRFHNGRGWVSSFDAFSAGALPVAVEIAIWFRQAPRGAAGSDSTIPGAGSARGLIAQNAPVPAGGVTRQPDRWRILAVPDGPEASWRAAG